MGFVIRNKKSGGFVGMICPDGKVLMVTLDQEALSFPNKGTAEAFAKVWTAVPASPGFEAVERGELQPGTEFLYMIRENRSMEYVAVISLDSVGTTKVGSRAIHYRDEVIANEQVKALMADQSLRTYTVIVSQTSVGIR